MIEDPTGEYESLTIREIIDQASKIPVLGVPGAYVNLNTPQQHGWYLNSPKENLPEMPGTYIAAFRTDNIQESYAVLPMEWNGNSWILMGTELILDRPVIAWQPLPTYHWRHEG